MIEINWLTNGDTHSFSKISNVAWRWSPVTSVEALTAGIIGTDTFSAPQCRAQVAVWFCSRKIAVMPRAVRFVLPDDPHHVTQRGNPMDVRVMEGGSGGPPRVVTSRAGTNDPLLPSGQQFPIGTPRQDRRNQSHVELDQ